MGFGMAKLTLSTFGRLRGGTPRGYSLTSNECSNERLWERGECSQHMVRG